MGVKNPSFGEEEFELRTLQFSQWMEGMSVADVSKSWGVTRSWIGYHEEIEGHQRSVGLFVSSDVNDCSEVSLFQTSVEP